MKRKTSVKEKIKMLFVNENGKEEKETEHETAEQSPRNCRRTLLTQLMDRF